MLYHMSVKVDSHISSNHLHEVPLVLIFGIATATTAVHRLLPHATSSLLSMEKFQAPPATDYLTQLINQVHSGGMGQYVNTMGQYRES